jgi:lactate racemase
MIVTQATAVEGAHLDWDTITETLFAGLEGRFTGQKVLVLIPDHTRTIPLPRLFPQLVVALSGTQQLDVMVALGTHPPLSIEHIEQLLGISSDERQERYGQIGFLNHAWDDPQALTRIATLPPEQVRELAGQYWHPSLPEEVPVNINRRILDYDRILIVGPTFPHEVAGFSGGAKYLFPGISGPEMINATHWLGALVGILGTIGLRQTPVRAMIHAAAEHVPRPVSLVSLVVSGDGLAGLFVGDYVTAWEAAAELSRRRHIHWSERAFQRVLSWAPPMYDELWTAGKAMYKLEPVVAEGGELIIYAPHLQVVSHTHGAYIDEIGYHVLPYFLERWERWQHIPLGVLAHSSHVRGAGRFEDGVEMGRIAVTLATQLPPEVCRRLNLGYLNPEKIDLAEWKDREDEGILFVPKAGETLYRLGSAEGDNGQ